MPWRRLKKAVELDPKFEKGYYNLGVAYASIDAIEESLASFKKTVEINPQYSDAYYNMGVAYAKKDQLDEAIKSLQKP